MNELPKSKYPRHLAVRALTRVLSDGETLDGALEALRHETPSSSWSWLQEICSGTLRWKGRLDEIINSVALRKKPSGWLRKLLLIATYQLVVQDRVHAGAVVSETVAEIKQKEGLAPSKFANACLRKIADHAQEWRKQSFQSSFSSVEQSHWASLPPWLWNKIVDQRGLEWAKAYAEASLERPFLWIRSQDTQWTSDWLEAGPLLNAWKSKQGGAIPEKEGFSEGRWIIQDISSQTLIAEVSQLVRPHGTTCLDLCAAPGGKSVGLSWNGFQVTATDHLPQRIPLLQQTVTRTQTPIEIVEWSQVIHLPQKDLVWVDAPCSGTGILRRHPEVRWLRHEKEIENLKTAQKDALKLGWEKVLPGKFLVYSVCSILKDEGSDLVHSLIEAGDLKASQTVKEWLLAPHLSPHGDGFWAILLKKLPS